jgi:outer membrane protein TolC
MKSFSVLFLMMAGLCAIAQMNPEQRPPTPLVEEAQQKNPEIQVAAHGAQAAGQAVRQAGALPDTQIMLQHLSVGSPRPFAGYTNSDFAYIGLGASQDFPWPGKRALKTQIAGAQADAVRTQSGAVSRIVIEQVKMTYFKLAYLQATLDILLRDDKLLVEMEQTAESRYRVGQGNQQEVLKAQLQHTRILQEIAVHHREQGQFQAQIKQLLGRTQDSPDIATETLRERTLPASASELLQAGSAKIILRSTRGSGWCNAPTCRPNWHGRSSVPTLDCNTFTRTQTANSATITCSPSRSRCPTAAAGAPNWPRPWRTARPQPPS